MNIKLIISISYKAIGQNHKNTVQGNMIFLLKKITLYCIQSPPKEGIYLRQRQVLKSHGD